MQERAKWKPSQQSSFLAVNQIMLGIILAALIGCGRVYPAMLNSSSSTQVGQEWWHTLPRAIVPNGPLIWPTDAPTAILFDQHPPPIMNLSKASLEYTGREGAKINMYLNPFTTLSDPSLASKCGGQWSAELTKYIQTGHITIFYPGGPAEYANDWNFIPKSPCCGQCSIGGIYAELMYWPTPAPTPAVTALVDKSGFTLSVPGFPNPCFSSILFDNLSDRMRDPASRLRPTWSLNPFAHMMHVAK